MIDGGASPCGFGARDTLRLEMGYPLWGQDLDPTTTPLEAGLEWVVGWDHEFVGREALDRRSAPPGRGAHPDRLRLRRAPGSAPRVSDCGVAMPPGSVTSGNFSPTLEVGIGMGYLTPDPGGRCPVDVEVRGEWFAARRVDPPFVER